MSDLPVRKIEDLMTRGLTNSPIIPVPVVPDDETRVIEVNPDGKYILIFPKEYTLDQVKSALSDLTDWWLKKDEPFLVLINGVRLVKAEGIKEVRLESDD